MPSLSIRKFVRQYDLDLIVASSSSIAIGDMVWDAVGITHPKLDKPGAPRNIYNALEFIGQLDATDREELQKQASDLPLVDAGLANLSIHVAAEHAGDFQYPAIVNLSTNIDLEKISSFTFANVRARAMPNSMRLATDRLLEAAKQVKWKDYNMTIRRSFIITELYYGSISVSLDRKVASASDVSVLTQQGFALKTRDTLNRIEVYTMDANGVPFAMRTELARRFSS
jgi:hypothetical protein